MLNKKGGSKKEQSKSRTKIKDSKETEANREKIPILSSPNVCIPPFPESVMASMSPLSISDDKFIVVKSADDIIDEYHC